MSDLAGIVFNIEFSLILGAITSFVLGFLLILIKVPNTDYSKKIVNTKNSIAACYMVVSALFYITWRYSGIANYEVLASLMMFIITATASVILSYSLITVLNPSRFDNDKFILNLGLAVVMCYIVGDSFWWESHTAKIVVISICIPIYIIQCVFHIIKFSRTYDESVKKLEQYYDEDENHKIKWVRFCYIIMMLTQMFVLVYLILPRGMMKIYIAFYSLFLVYFTANFISFLGSHKLLLDAFAYKTLSGQDIKDMLDARKNLKMGRKKSDEEFNEIEFIRLDRALDKWVKDKKYREFDKSREEIAKELNTTKEILHLYFCTRMSMDFRTWRTKLRIDDAKVLLLQKKNISVNVVGEMAGFSDRANFYRQFVKFVGCSPKDWRETNGGKKA
jgi:AraC-like DNA-binding protein